MKSISRKLNNISLPLIIGKFSMIEFNLLDTSTLPKMFQSVADSMLSMVDHLGGVGFFTIHGKLLKKGQTLRRGGPHTDGNYEPHQMSFGGGGGNGWKVGQDGPGINTDLHDRQYNNEKGGIIIASNYSACLGWNGNYDGMPNTGGDCSHIKLDKPFSLKKDTVYYGNNHFIHESLEMKDSIHRVFARITMPENHEFN